MRLLVIYTLKPNELPLRKTVDDSLFSFRRYLKGINIHYYNALFEIPSFLTKANYDAVILHESFLRFRKSSIFDKWFNKEIKNLKNITGIKIAIPQDEYYMGKRLCMIIKKYGIDMVLTLADKNDQKKLYSDCKSDVKQFIQILPGYVDEHTLDRMESLKKQVVNRDIDIGYRARKLPYWYGKHAQKKCEVGEKVKFFCQKNTTLKLDISSDPKDVFFGDDWIKFLLRCKATLGSEGGASIMDADGKIRSCVEAYISKHHDVTFKEVEKACFLHADGDLHYLSISPRHFEAAITKTCQILIEGEYSGILKPDVHYISLKSDYSNLEGVIEKLQDEDYRNWIVEQAYRDLIVSGKYTYSKFVNELIVYIRELKKCLDESNTYIEKTWFIFTGLRIKLQPHFKVLSLIKIIKVKTFLYRLYRLSDFLGLRPIQRIREMAHNSK